MVESGVLNLPACPKHHGHRPAGDALVHSLGQHQHHQHQLHLDLWQESNLCSGPRPRTTCSTIQVIYGDGCPSLAQRCGITPAQFTQYNPEPSECSSLQPGEHVCCSAGTLPNYAPQPQPDGTCATYTIQPDDDCSTIAATFSLTVDDIVKFNNDTWAWNGCKILYPNNIICRTHWKPQSQENFTALLGSVLLGWTAITQNQLFQLFNGSEASVAVLGSMIANGNLTECNYAIPSGGYAINSDTTTDVEGYIAQALFGFAIPAVWTLSGNAAFVLDSGYPCSAQNPLTQYMTDATQLATFSCYNNNLYYLVQPEGTWKGCPSEDIVIDCTGCDPPPPVCTTAYFTAPPGLDSLGPNTWGGITLDTLIQGSVNTYAASGNTNTGHIANPLDRQTIQDLANQDITTPGYIRLPVCSGQVAWASWSNPSQSNTSAPGYPCNPLQGQTKCSQYSYQDETSSASPLVTDCQILVANIQGTDGEWTTGIGSQRDLASFGSCNFGVQNSGTSGDVTYYTGSQDIVTIITQAIAQFASNGLVGAKGYMQCSSDAGGQDVVWGLY